MGEDKDREKYKYKAQRGCISHVENIYVMLKYTEVNTVVSPLNST